MSYLTDWLVDERIKWNIWTWPEKLYIREYTSGIYTKIWVRFTVLRKLCSSLAAWKMASILRLFRLQNQLLNLAGEPDVHIFSTITSSLNRTVNMCVQYLRGVHKILCYTHEFSKRLLPLHRHKWTVTGPSLHGQVSQLGWLYIETSCENKLVSLGNKPNF